jgi:NADH-quinone oxidoreductase subunit F
MCDRAPAALFTVAGERPLRYALGPVDSVTVANPPGGWTLFTDRPTPHPRLAGPLLSRVGTVDPTSIDDYLAHGGFRALTRARSLGPRGVVDAVAASGLVGRGGAAFPTGRKWSAVASAPAQPHYFVCNADESEPGTFKDRVLMEGDPFTIVEAIAIGAFAVGATHAFLYIRGEYPLAEDRMRHAITDATAAGHLDDLRIEVRRGAGAYICGEETALFSSIEGKRGEPRNKPPFPVDVGLFGKPTAVNNVETLANIPPILSGEPWTETKLFCLSGNVARPGLYEVPFGTTLRELLDLAGGVPSSGPIRAILLGGAAGTFVGPEALDTPLTFEGTRAIGATVGSGVVMVFDEMADLVGALRRIARFFRDESCGQCVPCRVGTVRQEELLDRIAAGERDQVGLLREVGQVMRDASICGLGQTASSAIESALRQPSLVSL